MGDQPVTRPLSKKNKKKNRIKQTSMPCVGFEPRIAVFKRAKIFNALGRANIFFFSRERNTL
jgi:hypothetical protein